MIFVCPSPITFFVDVGCVMNLGAWYDWHWERVTADRTSSKTAANAQSWRARTDRRPSLSSSSIARDGPTARDSNKRRCDGVAAAKRGPDGRRDEKRVVGGRVTGTAATVGGPHKGRRATPVAAHVMPSVGRVGVTVVLQAANGRGEKRDGAKRDKTITGRQ